MHSPGCSRPRAPSLPPSPHLPPAPLFSIPIPPCCWLCQVLGLVYAALLPPWLAAALPELSWGSWVLPQDPCPPQQSGSGHLPIFRPSLASGYRLHSELCPICCGACALLGQLGHGPPSQLPLVTGIWARRSHWSSSHPLETVNPALSAAAQTTSPACGWLQPTLDPLMAFVVDVASSSGAV